MSGWVTTRSSDPTSIPALSMVSKPVTTGGARKADTEEMLVKQLGQLLAHQEARAAMSAASHRVVEELGGALERTLSALEPYLLQLRIEMGAANA